MTLLDRIKNVMPGNALGATAGSSLQGMVGIGAAANYTDAQYKAIIPAFLYKPPFGYPLSKNIPEIRRLARQPFVAMITNTAIAEVTGQDWRIVAREDEEVPEDVLKQTEEFFYNPNRNDESLKFILDALIRDIMEIDAGVLIKVRDRQGNFVEMYARDGGLFNKNPDIYGIMPPADGEPAYYQYGWLTGARPIPFQRDEVVYLMQHPRTDSIYGLSNVEVLEDVIQLLTYGVDSNLEYFNDNNIPKGVLQLLGANAEDIKAFQQMWNENLKKKGTDGKWRKYFHKMPIFNSEAKFERVGFSNLELELLNQQQWFSKIVWATFNINPDELGFTENSNRSVGVMQSSVFKRKLIQPLVATIEYYFNTQVVNDLPWIKGKYENKVLFEFDKYDIQEEMGKRQLLKMEADMGVRTPNSIADELGLDHVIGGDVPRGAMSVGGFGFQSTGALNDIELSNEDSKEDDAEKETVEEGDEELKKKFTDLKSLDVELKHKYIKRSGSPGDYTYKYAADRKKKVKKLKEKLTKEGVAMGLVKLTPSERRLMKEELERRRTESKALMTSSPVTLKEFEFVASKNLKDLEKLVLTVIRKQMSETVEIKALDSALVKDLVNSIDFGNIKASVAGFIKHTFFRGLQKAERIADKNVVPNYDAINFLADYTFENVQGLEEDVKNDLRQVLQRGLIDGKPYKEIAKDVKGVFDKGEVRAKAIARTEEQRALVQGELNSLKVSGFVGTKTWNATLDKDTSPICKALNGTTVGVNEKFEYKGQYFDGPPAHVNCRSVLTYESGD